MNKPDNLTGKQWAFCLAYAKSWNGTEAARVAGYKGNDVTLASVGWENLRKPQIKFALKSIWDTMAMSTNEMFALLNDIALSDTEETRDRLRAIDMIGKGHAAFTDKVRQDVELVVTVKYENNS